MSTAQDSESGSKPPSTSSPSHLNAHSRSQDKPLAPGERRVRREGSSVFIERGKYPAKDVELGDGRSVYVPSYDGNVDVDWVRRRVAEIERRFGRRIKSRTSILWLVRHDEEYTKLGGAHLHLSPAQYADRILNEALEPEAPTQSVPEFKPHEVYLRFAEPPNFGDPRARAFVNWRVTKKNVAAYDYLSGSQREDALKRLAEWDGFVTFGALLQFISDDEVRELGRWLKDRLPFVELKGADREFVADYLINGTSRMINIPTMELGPTSLTEESHRTWVLDPRTRQSSGTNTGEIPGIENATLVSQDGRRSVKWRGQTFSFTPLQAAIVMKLHEALQKGTPEVSHALLLAEAGSDSRRLRDVFKAGGGLCAWGTLILTYPKTHKGTARLAP